MSENKVGRPSRSEPRHVFYFNKPTYEVWTRLKSKVSRSSGEKSLSSNEIALWLLQSYETRFTDSCTRCAKINSENINDDADGIKENSQDGDVHSRSVASFCSGSTARPQSTDVAQAPLKDLFHPASFACAVSWFAFIVAIFMGHGNGDDKGQPKDRTCKECWMKQIL